MKNVFIFMLVVFCLLLSATAFADGAEPEEETSMPVEEISPTEEIFLEGETLSSLLDVLLGEINALQAEVQELREALVAFQSDQTEIQISIGVMPVDGSQRIPCHSDFFREMMISSLSEAGINAVESLDEETLDWVRRQDQLVREGWLDPITVPRRGELNGVSHYLFATVSCYDENWSNEDSIGPITVRYDGVRIRRGYLSIDFRLVDAASGAIVSAFQVATEVKERTGAVLFDASFDSRPVSEIACRSVAAQAAERIAGLLNPLPEITEEQITTSH